MGEEEKKPEDNGIGLRGVEGLILYVRLSSKQASERLTDGILVVYRNPSVGFRDTAWMLCIIY